MAPMGKIKQFLSGHNFDYVYDSVVIFSSRVWFLGANLTVSFQFTPDSPWFP